MVSVEERTTGLNRLIRGELSAVETYRQALDKMKEAPEAVELHALLVEHRAAVEVRDGRAGLLHVEKDGAEAGRALRIGARHAARDRARARAGGDRGEHDRRGGAARGRADGVRADPRSFDEAGDQHGAR